MDTAAATFQTGSTYRARSAADHETVFSFRVVKRTAKFVTFVQGGDEHRVGVKVDDRGEWALPFGTYSMAPVVRAA